MRAISLYVNECIHCPYSMLIPVNTLEWENNWFCKLMIETLADRIKASAIPDPQTIPDFCPLAKVGGG